MTLALFIQKLADDPMHFGFVLFTVVISITLHELAHGWAALWQGDPTPRVRGHMTPNPIVHMGWFSIVLFITTGMAFGLMPVDPTRFRSKYGHALVAAAGPLMNLLLASVALIIAGLMVRHYGFWDEGHVSQRIANTQQFFWFFGYVNVALMILNLLPIPPLDGSAILANLNPPYDRFVRSVNNPNTFIFLLIGVLVLFSWTDFGLFEWAMKLSLLPVNAISGADLFITDTSP